MPVRGAQGLGLLLREATPEEDRAHRAGRARADGVGCWVGGHLAAEQGGQVGGCCCVGLDEAGYWGWLVWDGG